MAYVTIGCRFLVGVVFVVSALSKLRSGPAYHAFAAWLAGLPVGSARMRKSAAPVIAAAEAVIVVLLALPWTARAGLLAAALALAMFAAGIFLAVRRGASEPCRCFGASTVPLRIRHVVRNAMLCAVAVVGAATAATGSQPRPAWAGLSLAFGAIAAVLVVFLDDIAVVFGDPATLPIPVLGRSDPDHGR